MIHSYMPLLTACALALTAGALGLAAVKCGQAFIARKFETGVLWLLLGLVYFVAMWWFDIDINPSQLAAQMAAAIAAAPITWMLRRRPGRRQARVTIAFLTTASCAAIGMIVVGIIRFNQTMRRITGTIEEHVRVFSPDRRYCADLYHLDGLTAGWYGVNLQTAPASNNPQDGEEVAEGEEDEGYTIKWPNSHELDVTYDGGPMYLQERQWRDVKIRYVKKRN